MSKGKLVKFAEMEQFPHVFQFPYAKLKADGFPLAGNWRNNFFKNNNPIIIELGCGKGEYTVGLAKQFPHKNFIGVDIKGSRMWKGAKESHLEGMNNVAFIRTNIEIIDHFFAAAEIDEIWLTFPDPQMKKVRKRLTATNFIEMYLRFLKPDGIVNLKTDSHFQFTYTHEMVKANHFEIVDIEENVHQNRPTNEVMQIRTYYENQWISRGLTIKYIAFKPQNKPLVEPETEIEFDEYRSYGRSKNTPKTHGR